MTKQTLAVKRARDKLNKAHSLLLSVQNGLRKANSFDSSDALFELKEAMEHLEDAEIYLHPGLTKPATDSNDQGST